MESQKAVGVNSQCQFRKSKHFAITPFFTCFYDGELRVYQFLELFKTSKTHIYHLL
jgi:hypothetical protein